MKDKETTQPKDFLDLVLSSLNPHALGFRAAAHEAAGKPSTPIRGRVLHRIVNAPEFCKEVFPPLLDQLRAKLDVDVNTAVHPPAEIARVLEELHELLGKDRRFSVLVLDLIDRDRSWGDLVGGKFNSVWDWFKSLLEKALDKGHPIARLTTSLVMGGATALLTLHLALRADLINKDLLLPMRVDVRLNQDSLPLEVNLKPKWDLGVGFRPEVNGTLKLNVEPKTHNVTLGFEPSTIQVRTSVEPTTAGIDAAKELTSEMRGIKENLKEIATQAKGGADSIGKAVNLIADGTRVQVALAEESVRDINLAYGNIQSKTLVVPESKPGSITLQWFDRARPDKLLFCNVLITARRNGKGLVTTAIEKGGGNGCDDLNGPSELALQKARSLGLPYQITLVKLESAWWRFGKPRLYFRFDQTGTANVATHTAGNQP